MTLYVVATPLGNLGDITLRAIDTLKKCTLIAAEDTRRTAPLLMHLGIEKKPLVSLHAHNEAESLPKVLARLEAGEDVALVSDAGTPLVSDPGSLLVDACIEKGIAVVPIPGASAVLTALVGSGFGGGGFHFFGFLPRSGKVRKDRLESFGSLPEPIVIFEAANRTHETLVELAALYPTRAVCIARELTKIYEEFIRGTLGELAKEERAYRGEVVIVLGRVAATTEEVTDETLAARIAGEASGTRPLNEVAREIALWSGRKKSDVYSALLDARKK